jgi:hypothetical protein
VAPGANAGVQAERSYLPRWSAGKQKRPIRSLQTPLCDRSRGLHESEADGRLPSTTAPTVGRGTPFQDHRPGRSANEQEFECPINVRSRIPQIRGAPAPCPAQLHSFVRPEIDKLRHPVESPHHPFESRAVAVPPVRMLGPPASECHLREFGRPGERLLTEIRPVKIMQGINGDTSTTQTSRTSDIRISKVCRSDHEHANTPQRHPEKKREHQRHPEEFVHPVGRIPEHPSSQGHRQDEEQHPGAFEPSVGSISLGRLTGRGIGG